MSTTTHRIPLDPGRYTNVSNGNLNCTLVVPTEVQLRVLFASADAEPDPETEDYVLVTGPGTAAQGRRASIVTATNLAGESDMWVCGDAEVVVFRGEGVITIASGS